MGLDHVAVVEAATSVRSCTSAACSQAFRCQDILEIRSADGHHASVLLVEPAQAEIPAPNTELIFERDGDQYFLVRLFEEGRLDGDEVPDSATRRWLRRRGRRR